MNRVDKRIINLRAFAIVMVVLGHSIILYSDKWTLYSTIRTATFCNYLKDWIDLIQMPLFFSLSGYLFYISYKKLSFMILLVKKVKRLLISYIAFSFLWLIPIRKIVEYSGYQGKSLWDVIIYGVLLGNDNGHLWFLPCLFICFLLSYAIFRGLERLLLSEKLQSVISFTLAYILSHFFYLLHGFPGVEIFRAVMIYWIWFCIGFIFCRHNIFEKCEKIKWIIAILSILCSSASLTKIIPFKNISTIVLLICCYALVPQTTNKVSEFLSENSFGIYLFHSPLIYITFLQIPNANPFLVICINFLCLGGVAVLLTLVLRRSRFRVLVGE